MLKHIENILLKYRQAQFTAKKQQHLLEDLANLLEDGVSVNIALELMIGFAHSPLEVEVIRSMQLKMASGESFVLGMEGWCGNNLIEIIRAGEEGGTLVDSIRMAASSVQGQNEAIAVIVQSMMYPGAMFCIGLVMLVYIASTVFPNFEAIKPLSQWPTVGQFAVGLSRFISGYWWLLIAGIFGIIFLIKYILNNYIGDLRVYVDQIPPFKIFRQINGARLMQTLGLLLRNGVLLKQALKIAQRNMPPYMQSHLLMMEFRLSGGRDNIADVLDTGLIDQQDLARLRIVAMGKGFDEALMRQGKRSMAASIASLKLLGKIGGGALMAITACLLGLIFYALYSVGLSMTNG
ncbi:MAG: tcpE [Gammaproteobacteria bacterium]|jgi:type II secretory pathway component PulF|nr:tcpE [Gammaproteobacteria bacterium]